MLAASPSRCSQHCGINKGGSMGMRTFRDADGREWRAWDVSPDGTNEIRFRTVGHLPPEMASGWLCFESGELKRRLTPVPHRWDEDDDASLCTLCSLAVPVTRPARSLTTGASL
jgi:hypothetical protein